MNATTTIIDRKCRHCRHFRNDARFLEAAFPGLTSMSSAYGSVRAEDGICLRHDRYLSAESSCPQFSEIVEIRILPDSAAKTNPSPPHGGARQTSSYFSRLLAAPRQSLLSVAREHAGVPSMTDLPHELNGLEPPSVASWLTAFGTALVALIAIGILPHVWG